MPILQEDLRRLAELTKALTEENSGYVKDVRLINKFGEEKWYRIHINSIWIKKIMASCSVYRGQDGQYRQNET